MKIRPKDLEPEQKDLLTRIAHRAGITFDRTLYTLTHPHADQGSTYSRIVSAFNGEENFERCLTRVGFQL